MNDAAFDPRYLEVFPQWLRSLGEDAAVIGEALASSAEEDDASHWLVGGLNYIFKSLDLIPDGIDDLGYLDDAFVLRMACNAAVVARPELRQGTLERLADDARTVRDFLGEGDYERLETYVAGLRKGAARGRTVHDVVSDSAVRAAFVHEVRAWAAGYRAPSFTRDVKTLVKLKAFLGARLA
jgi:uncharacterized membrane protein YkvA (DUF1232 family)